MSEKRFSTKRQHFVPRHYLRQFALRDSEQISCIRIDPYQFIKAAGISGQCQDDYFYGDDGALESLLSEDESEIAPMLVRAVREERFNNEDLLFLQMLAVMLHARTRKAAEIAKLVPKRIADQVIRHGIATGEIPAPEGGWEDGMMDFTGVSGDLLSSSFYCWFEMRTLKYKLLRAQPGAAFVTSDHPCITLNQLAMGLDSNRSFVGFAQAGFQLVLPISPVLCLFFYDSQVYKLSERRRQMMVISREDVDVINGFQVQEAEKCLYFNELVPEEHARSLVERYGTLRRPIQQSLRIVEGQNSGEELLHMRASNPQMLKPWTFCKRLRTSRVQVGELRNPGWTDAIERLMDGLQKNPGTDFDERLERIYAEGRK
jgi:hypothetical protein